jgi:XTP/dITP diphosphohydrolase
VPFGQPALALTAQLQRRAARAGVPEEVLDADGQGTGTGADTGTGIGERLFNLVTMARAAGLDPEMELRSAARRFSDRVRAWEQRQLDMVPNNAANRPPAQ